jgi:O-antigen/teichoic acid export membrane protein
MVPFLFAGLLLPMFSKMIKNFEPFQPLLGFAFNLLMVTSLSFALACFAYRAPIMDMLYVHHPEVSSVILGILMISFVFISITYIFGTLLTANGNIRFLNLISGIGVMLNIGLNILFIPRYQVVGAAIASVITQFVMALMQVALTFRVFDVKVKLKQVFLFCIFIFGSILLTYLSHLFFSYWFIGFVFCIGSCLLLAFVVRIFRISDIVSFLFQRHQG